MLRSFNKLYLEESIESAELQASLNFKCHEELREQLVKESLCKFLWRQNDLRQGKPLDRNTLTLGWLEFQSLLLLACGDVERNPGPLTST